MAAVAAGCVTVDSPGYVCLGTSAWYACATTEPVLDAEERSFNLCHVVPACSRPTATTQTGAGSVQWAAEALAEAPDEVGRLISEASAAVAADEDLYFLPYLHRRALPVVGREGLRARSSADGCTTGVPTSPAPCSKASATASRCAWRRAHARRTPAST